MGKKNIQLIYRRRTLGLPNLANEGKL